MWHSLERRQVQKDFGLPFKVKKYYFFKRGRRRNIIWLDFDEGYAKPWISLVYLNINSSGGVL
jgi:hypothetical protein